MTEPKILKASFNKNPFIGLYSRSSEKLTIIPKNAPEKFANEVETALKTETVRIFISQCAITGILSALNSNGCVLPSFADEEEKRIIRKKGINVCTISEKYAPGNNILVNDYAALVNPSMDSKDRRKIGECFNVEVFTHPIAGCRTVGAMNVVTNRGLLAYNEISQTEVKMLEKIFKVNGSIGTANMGSAANALNLTANSNGAVIGELTSGFELQRIYEALFG